MSFPPVFSLLKHPLQHTRFCISDTVPLFEKDQIVSFQNPVLQDQFPPLKMKASVVSLLGVAAAVSAGYDKPSTTSTVYTTSVYTITSCAASVTDCPERGSVTTDIISLYTTICPVTETETPSSYTKVPPPTSTEVPWTTSTIYTTTEYTITACPAYVTNCPVGSKTTEVLTSTTYCPVTSSYPAAPPAYSASGVPYPPSSPSAPVSPPSKPSYPAIPPPVLTTVYETTCVPTVITSIYTVTGTPAQTPTYPASGVITKPYSTGSPTGGSYPVGPQNSTVPFTGAAGANKVGGLLMAVGLAAALL